MRSKGKVRWKMVKKKEWRGLEEYSGRVEGKTDPAGDVKVNYG